MFRWLNGKKDKRDASTDDSQRDRLLQMYNVLKTRLSEGRMQSCVACQSNNWALQSQAAYLGTYDIASNKKRYDGDNLLGVPVMVIVCQHCGYLMLFNIFMVGHD